MAKKIKLQNKDGSTIEIWDSDKDQYSKAGWSEHGERKPQPKPIKENKGE